MWSPHLRGQVAVPPGVDGRQLLAHVAADLRRREAEVREEPGRLVVARPTPGRMSVLAFVDGGGAIWLEGARLRYDFGTAGSLVICAVFAVVGAGLAWFYLESGALALFALCGALPWLYGANYVTCLFRIPAYFERLGRTVPGAAPPPLPGTGGVR